MPNPCLDTNLVMDYDLLESMRCLCGLKKELGARMCGRCYGQLSTPQQVALAGIRPGEGVANTVAGLVRRG